MAMAGFGRGYNFDQPRHADPIEQFLGRGRGRGQPSRTTSFSSDSEAANKWATSVRQSAGASARPSVPNDVVERHIEDLSRIWMDERVLDKRKKSQAVSKRLTEILRDVRNPWEFILRVICGAPDYEDAKTSSLAFTILLEFRNWTTSPENRMKVTSEQEDCLCQDLRVQAFNAFTGKHMPFFQVASKAFRLNHEGNDYFVPMIKPLLQQNKLTDAANIVGGLGLQDHFSQEEIIIPLLLSDKVNMLESYVASSQVQQVALLSLLDHLCARNTDILSFAQNSNVKNIKGQKLSKKILSKFAVRLMKLHSIPPETCPNITENRAMGAIRYLLFKRYVEKSLGAGGWDDMVESAVGDSSSLQEQLVEELLAYNDLTEAARWANRYNLRKSAIDPAVAIECRRLREAEELQPKAEAGGGSVGAEENWDLDSRPAELSERQRFYRMPLPESQIMVVDNRGKLKACLYRLTEPGTTIGIDAEWKPAMGAGSVERVALLQLAVEEAVYLVDLVELTKILTDEEWTELAESVFCHRDVLKIGFGLDHDLRMLGKTSWFFAEALQRMVRVVDLEKLAAKVMVDGQGTSGAASSDQAGEQTEKPCKKSSHFQKHEEKGLSLLVKTLLGKPLSKGEQMSNWEKRPLRQSQIIYAACDAFVLLDLYKLLRVRGEAMGLSESEMEPGSNLKLKSRMDKKKEKATAAKKSPSGLTPGQAGNAGQESVASPAPCTERGGEAIRPYELRVVCNNMLQGLGSQLRSCGVDSVILGPNIRHDEAVKISKRENRIVLSSGKVFDQIRAGVGAAMCLRVPHNISARDQCMFVFNHFRVNVQKEDIFTRCSVCNGTDFVDLPSKDMEALSMFALQQQSMAGHSAGVRPSGASLCDVDPSTQAKFMHYGIDPVSITFLHNRVRIQVETVPSRKVFKGIDSFFVCTSCGKVYWEGSHYENISAQFSNILNLHDDTGEELQSPRGVACRGGKNSRGGAGPSARGRRQDRNKSSPEFNSPRQDSACRGGRANTGKKQKFEAGRYNSGGKANANCNRGGHSGGSSVDGYAYDHRADDLDFSGLYDPLNDVDLPFEQEMHAWNDPYNDPDLFVEQGADYYHDDCLNYDPFQDYDLYYSGAGYDSMF